MIKELGNESVKRNISNSIIVFLLASSLICVLMPSFANSVSSDSMPSIALLATVSIVLIAFTSILFNFLSGIMKGSKAWLVMGTLYGSVSVIVNFFLIPVEYYSHSYQTGLLTPDPNQASVTLIRGFMTMAINVLMCMFVYRLVKGKSTMKKKSMSVVAIVITVFVILSALFITGAWIFLVMFNPFYYLESASLWSILIITMSGLVFVIFKQYLQESVKVSSTVWKGSLMPSFFGIGIVLAFSYSFLWIIYMIVLLSIWKLDVVSSSM